MLITNPTVLNDALFLHFYKKFRNSDPKPFYSCYAVKHSNSIVLMSGDKTFTILKSLFKNINNFPDETTITAIPIYQRDTDRIQKICLAYKIDADHQILLQELVNAHNLPIKLPERRKHA